MQADYLASSGAQHHQKEWLAPRMVHPTRDDQGRDRGDGESGNGARVVQLRSRLKLALVWLSRAFLPFNLDLDFLNALIRVQSLSQGFSSSLIRHTREALHHHGNLC